MEVEKVRLRTYRQVWAQERVIYQIERVRLPFPITFRQAGVFGVTVLVMAVLSQLPGVTALPGLSRYLLIPAAVTWFLTQQRLDGKNPPAWSLSMLRFALSPKRLNRLRPIEQGPARLRFRNPIGYGAKG